MNDEEAAYQARRARRRARRRVGRYAERLLENESWRTALNDDEAQPLLAWGLTYLEHRAAQLAGRPEAEIEAQLDAVSRQITTLLAGLDSLMAGQEAATPPDPDSRTERLRLLALALEELTQTPLSHVQHTRLAQINAAYPYLGRRQLLAQLKSLFLPPAEATTTPPPAEVSPEASADPADAPPSIPSPQETPRVSETLGVLPAAPSPHEVSHEVWIE